jgi:parvulin-like peptidyl-prolyl isomerase
VLGQDTPGGAKPAAVVNGEPIALTAVTELVGARTPVVPLTPPQQREIRQAALDMLVDDLLMRQFLRKNAPAATAAAIDKEIAELKKVLDNKKKTLADFLREGQQTEEQLRADVVARVQWKSYLVARIPDAELKAYYDANKVFFDKVFVTASHILVKANQDAKARQAAREKLDHLRQEIVGGKITFEEAARKYSDCPSKDKGGDIGPFPYKFVVVEPFAKAAFSMKVNDISDIVSTDFGLHLIKVTKRADGEPTTFEAVRDAVRETFAQEQELYQKILAEQRKTAKIEVLLQ